MSDLKQTIAREYGTPAIVIDLDVVTHNIARLQAACEARGLRNRPHIKTTRAPYLAEITRCGRERHTSKPRSGMRRKPFPTNIRISYNLISEEKIDRASPGCLSAR